MKLSINDLFIHRKTAKLTAELRGRLGEKLIARLDSDKSLDTFLRTDAINRRNKAQIIYLLYMDIAFPRDPYLTMHNVIERLIILYKGTLDRNSYLEVDLISNDKTTYIPELDNKKFDKEETKLYLLEKL